MLNQSKKYLFCGKLYQNQFALICVDISRSLNYYQRVSVLLAELISDFSSKSTKFIRGLICAKPEKENRIKKNKNFISSLLFILTPGF
jgi:hypothetical protein